MSSRVKPALVVGSLLTVLPNSVTSISHGLPALRKPDSLACIPVSYTHLTLPTICSVLIKQVSSSLELQTQVVSKLPDQTIRISAVAGGGGGS